MMKREKSFLLKKSRQDRVYLFIIYFIGTIFLLACAYPLLYVVSASVSSPASIISGRMKGIPIDFSLDSYKWVLQDNRIWRGYLNTIYYSVVGTLINLVLTTFAAYPLSRTDLKGRNILTMFFTFTMFFSGGLIPNYLLIRDLGLRNTVWALVLPGAISVYNMLILRNFFQNSIPGEMIEAACVDGCSNVGTLLRIVAPLSKSIYAVLVIFYFVGHWNTYFSALLYIDDTSKHPLQMVIREILIKVQSMGAGGSEGLDVGQQRMLFVSAQYAVILVASIPVLLIYPFAQKHLVKGVMIGSIKG